MINYGCKFTSRIRLTNSKMTATTKFGDMLAGKKAKIVV